MKKPLMCSAVHLLIIVLSMIVTSYSYALTLDEAINLARETLPSYKASQFRVDSSEALYKASLSPYLPAVDATARDGRIFTSSREFKTRAYDLTLSYTLFDWGNRRANRNIAGLNLGVSQEDLRRTVLDLEFNVKSAFYNVLAFRDSLEQRKIQLKDTEKDYEVADGRYRFGAAKLSDVLQASVRLEQARFNVIQSEGDLKKAISDLNSLIGRPLDTTYDVEGSLDQDMRPPDIAKLSEIVLRRPEIKQVENTVKISENSKSAIRSTFFPTFSADASYIKTEGDIIGQFFREEKTVNLRATWNIFELGKFYNYKSAELEKNVSMENLNDLKRQFLLDLKKTYEDFLTAVNKLEVAHQQLKQAEQNYSQAFGEYKVGKADILALVQAESFLADSRQQLIRSKLDVMLSKTLLERVAGIEKLESLSY